MSSHDLRVHFPADLCPSMEMAAGMAGGSRDTCHTLDPIPALSLPAIPQRLDPSAATIQSQLASRRCEGSMDVEQRQAAKVGCWFVPNREISHVN